MAGIGFELKKLFKGKGLLQVSRACLFSMLITVGPTLLCILMLTTLQILMYNWGIPVPQRELFMAAVIYSFIFSLILTGGFSAVLSRYVSDKIYINKTEDILPSLKGAIIICMIAGGIAGTAFYYRSPLNFEFKLVSYILFMELIVLWLEMVYVSALRDYMKLMKGFSSGVIAVLFLAYVLVQLLKIDAIVAVLASIDLGFFIIILYFFGSIQSCFNHTTRKCFAFLEYLDLYPTLFLTGLLYTLGLYTHNFMFWLSRNRVAVADTYVFSPVYDVPSFWAFLTALPAIIIFIVSCETTFYEKYKAYYDTICNGGTLDTIIRCQNEMRDAISRGLRKVMGMQIIFTVTGLTAGIVFLPLAGLEHISIDMFDILAMGYYAFIIMFTFFTVLLYFDDKKGALILVFFFTLSNTVLTGLTIKLGEMYYGSGFTAAAFLSLLVGFFRLNHILSNIHYYTFCSQPIIQNRKHGMFTWISIKLHSVLNKTKAA